MKRARIWWLGLIIAPLVVAAGVSAKVVQSDRASVPAGETVDEDVFLAGQSVVIDGTVNGDVYAAGNQITVNGTINGELFAAGQVITVSGTIHGLRAAGQTIVLQNGHITGGVTVAAQQLSAETTSTIDGGLVFAGKEGLINSPVGRGIVAAANHITLGNTVGRNAQVAAQEVVLISSAHIGGDLIYRSAQDAKVDSGAVVVGRTNKIYQATDRHRGAGDRLGFKLWSLLGALVVGALFIRFLPGLAQGSSAAVRQSTWASLGWGLVVLIVTVPVIILLLVSVIGIPLALILMGLYALEIYLAKIVVGMALGRLLVDWFKLENHNAYFGLLVGLVVFYVLTIIPWIGVPISLLGLLLGLGGMWMAKRTKLNQPAS